MESLSWESMVASCAALSTELAGASWALRGLLLAVTAIMVVFVVLFATFFARARSLRTRRGAEIYRYLSRRLGLSRSEQQLADRISSYYHPPETKYMVLVDELDFDDCAARAEERGSLEEMTLSALRLKLDFGAGNPEEAPGSSAELGPGTPVIIVQKGRPSIRGRVAESESDSEGELASQSLVVELDTGTEPPTVGVPVSVYFHNPAGVFVFASYARRLVKNRIHLDHSDVVRPSQRRRYYRKAVKLPVYVMLRDKLEEPVRSAILDLSGGGASLENPGMSVTAGDELALSFSPGGERFTVPARVIRLSASGRVMHVQFLRLSESARDRLIGSLFKAQGRT
ncbi:MAG: PilZ domain-containing protein [Spirochaetales bacterium]|nr:PilZ domain-containing protein [Spirochaetales bacterium]